MPAPTVALRLAAACAAPVAAAPGHAASVTLDFGAIRSLRPDLTPIVAGLQEGETLRVRLDIALDLIEEDPTTGEGR